MSRVALTGGRMSRSVGLAVVAIAALLGACSGQPPPVSPQASLTPTASLPTPTARVSATTEGPPPNVVTYECTDDDFETFDYFAELPPLWAKGRQSCEATVSGPLLDEQKAAIAAAYGVDGDPQDIAVLYGICAERLSQFGYLEDGGSPAQVREVRAALLLCPDHPDLADLESLLSTSVEMQQLRDSGRIFAAGVYRVGKEIKPGTYAIEGEIVDCYWERQDSSGEIIDNNFISAAKRVEVTIRSSDYAFSSSGCGEWRPA